MADRADLALHVEQVIVVSPSDTGIRQARAKTDLFGAEGRRWLSGLQLPDEQRETVDGAMRQIAFSLAISA